MDCLTWKGRNAEEIEVLCRVACTSSHTVLTVQGQGVSRGDVCECGFRTWKGIRIQTSMVKRIRQMFSHVGVDPAPGFYCWSSSREPFSKSLLEVSTLLLSVIEWTACWQVGACCISVTLFNVHHVLSENIVSFQRNCNWGFIVRSSVFYKPQKRPRLTSSKRCILCF